MLHGFGLAYAVFTLILVFVDCYFAFRSYCKGGLEGLYLARCSALAAFIAFSYLLSILLTGRLAVSVMSSIYFISIDWLLIMMIRFVTVFTTRATEVITRPIMRAIQAYAWFETAVFAVNPFKEIAISYVRRDTPIAFYAYEMKPLYTMHLAFTYLMVIALLGILTQKCLRTPKNYRIQYVLFIGAILLIVIINAFFILPFPWQGRSILYLIDSSIPGYSLGLFIMYWTCFKYRDSYLKQSLSKMVFDNLEQGIALFDYNGGLVLRNERLGEMLPEHEIRDGMNIDAFEDISGIDRYTRDAVDSYSQQIFSGDSGEGFQMRCDYSRLRDGAGRKLGELFVFTDAEEEIDLLTGYHSWDHFRKYVRENPGMFSFPYAVAEFDMNGLGSINRNQGKDVGDQLIRDLAKLIREHMPEESYYVRGYDARLIVISYYLTEEEMIGYGERVIRDSGETVHAGYCSSADGSDDVIDVIYRALRSMKIKKLLDDDSTHSQTITSLVRALRESDSDTEAHVKRTQRMGRELGKRFGLSDLEMSQLSLLCLLHDIGKVGIPLEILNKPGKLTPEEWEVLKTHSLKGYQIAVSSWELRDIAEMILYHHERWDGKGYPSGLAGNEIPFLSRVISVVDSFDAMVNNRSYRKAISIEDAKAEMKRCSGTQFDPVMTEEFLSMLEEYPDMASGITDDEQSGDDVVIPVTGSVESMAAARQGAAHRGSAGGRRPRAVTFSRYIMDINDYILSADEDFETITGYTFDDVENKWLRQEDLIPEDHREEYFEDVARQLQNGDVVYMEHDLVRKDGRHVYVFCFAKRHYDSASKTVRTEVIIVDSSTTRAFSHMGGSLS